MDRKNKYLGLLLCFAASSLIATGCHHQLPLQLKGHNNYLPLTSGNEWSFHSQRSSSATYKNRAGDYLDLEGQTFVVWEDIIEDSTTGGIWKAWHRRYLRYGENGEILELPDHEPRDRAKLFPSGLLAAIKPMYKTEAQVGESWEMYEMLPTGAGIGKVRSTLVSRDDSVTLPTGTVRHCLRFRFDKDAPFNQEEFSYEEWLAPGIGPVRRQGVGDQKVDSLHSYTVQ